MDFRIRAGLFLLGSVVAGWVVGAGSRDDRTFLVFLSVGQGDCAVFHSDGHTILIDDGPADEYEDAGERIVAPKLRALGVGGVDAIFLSHSDADHVGGTGAILKAYPGARIVMSDQFRSSDVMAEDLRRWGKSAADVVWLPASDEVRIGSFLADISCPPMSAGSDANDGSMFLRLRCGEASAMFSGDAPIETERKEEGVGRWDAEILKVGHHGSRTATDESWIEWVHPSVAVISVGRNNRYGHPNREVLDRLAGDHVPVLRTDLDGDIRFEVRDGRFVRVR